MKHRPSPITVALLQLPNPNGWRTLPVDVDLRDPKALDRFMPPPEIMEQAKAMVASKAKKGSSRNG